MQNVMDNMDYIFIKALLQNMSEWNIFIISQLWADYRSDDMRSVKEQTTTEVLSDSLTMISHIMSFFH